MAKIFIEESTLTSIGDAIRGKEGTTELIPTTEMASRITAIEGGGGEPNLLDIEITSNGVYDVTDAEGYEEYDGFGQVTVNVPLEGAPTSYELIVTGDCSYRFANGGWDWFIKKYRDRITTKGVQYCSNMFYSCKVEEIPFQINVTNGASFTNMLNNTTKLTHCPKIRGTISWQGYPSLQYLLAYSVLSDVEDLFTPDMLEGVSTVKISSAYSVPNLSQMFNSCDRLRKVPSWWYKFRINEESSVFPSYSYTIYNSTFAGCYTLDEITNIPVWKCAGAQTSNMFSNTTQRCYRLKNFTFETDNGAPIVTQWKSQVFSLDNVGWSTYAFYFTDAGISADKEVKDDTTYQALKDDPDWFTCLLDYSRYNHDSAVATINSLPDTSAYLASAGGTNTIKFKGSAGSKTDGGAINTLTEEEIAVATAKGWTVTLV